MSQKDEEERLHQSLIAAKDMGSAYLSEWAKNLTERENRIVLNIALKSARKMAKQGSVLFDAYINMRQIGEAQAKGFLKGLTAIELKRLKRTAYAERDYHLIDRLVRLGAQTDDV